MHKKKLLFFIFCFLSAVLLYFTESQGLKVVLLAGIIYSATLIKGINQFLVYMCVSVVAQNIESPALLLIGTLPLFISPASFKSASKHLIPLVIIAVLAGISYTVGENCQITTMMVYFTSLLVFVQVMDSNISHEEFFQYSALAAVILITVLGYSAINGTLELRYGRISINGNIREVANLISIPVFSSWSMIMLQENKRIILYYIVGLASSFVLLLTISKGALAATGGGLMIVYLASTRKFHMRSIFSIGLASVAVVVIFMYAQTLEGYHFGRLFDEYDGFSGRTEIWELYLYHFKENFSTVLFGFGPGDLKRLMITEYYAHSLFLDMLFCYGVAMALVWIIILASITRMVFKSKDAFAMGLFVFTVLLFATHGNVTFPMFYVQTGVAISFAKCNRIESHYYSKAYFN